jgi:ribosomal protein L11 methyltransferase
VSYDETDEARGLWQVIGFFPSRQDALASLQIDSRLAANPIPAVDWVRRSLEGLPPVKAGRFYIHGSHHRERRRSGGVSIEIDAATAFGTGHHGTTWGCLAAFDCLLKGGEPHKVLDVGCGTGVLAIAAARAHCSVVIASDIDPEAVKTTHLNALRNEVGTSLKAVRAIGVHHPAIRREAPFNLVFANILARPLVSLAPALVRLLAPGGRLILSGLTHDQVRWVSARYRNQGAFPDFSLASGKWMTLVYKRKRPA